MSQFIIFISIQIGKMSQMYIMEPPTNGKIVLRTSAGDIDIELWVRFLSIYNSQYFHILFSQKRHLLQLETLSNCAWRIITMQQYFIDLFLVLLYKVEIQLVLEWAEKVFMENHSKTSFILGYVHTYFSIIKFLNSFNNPYFVIFSFDLLTADW